VTNTADALNVLFVGIPAVVLIVFAVAAVEVGIRRRRQRRRAANGEPKEPRSLGARQAQHLYERVLFGFAPAVVAGAIAASRNDDLGLGLFVLGVMVATRVILWPARSPLHLMPVARTVLYFATPALGIAAAVAPGLFVDWPLTLDTMLSALLGAWLITLLGILLDRRFDADAPVRLAVIGGPDLATKLALELSETRISGFRVIGFIAPGPIKPALKGAAQPWLGELSDVREVVKGFNIDLLAVGPENPRLHLFEHTAKELLDLPVRMVEASALYEDVLGHVPIGQINSAWFQAIMHPRHSPASPVSKRALDLLIALPVSVALLPLIPLVCLAIWAGDRGPVLYRQRRVGEFGNEFDILKFRTMRVDAPQPSETVPKESLVTPIGRLLRRTHLDELPQLVNVIRGEMTLVGPRPEQPMLVRRLATVVPYYDRRSLVKPGLTGWAQVRCGYAGSAVGTAWKICHDLYYLKHRSLVFDVLILLQTFHLFSQADVELPTPDRDFILGQAALAGEHAQSPGEAIYR
jgi:lipopolysaccharide/colanic/teichoic acid biosynthesis glycosyltransferase